MEFFTTFLHATSNPIIKAIEILNACKMKNNSKSI